MLLPELKPAVQVGQDLLFAVRERYDRVAYRPGQFDFSYEKIARFFGRDVEDFGPSTVAAQKFPAVLAAYGPAWRRVWLWLTRLARRHCGVSEAGAFQFPIGRGIAAIKYRAQWAGGRLAELVFEFSADDSLTVAAHRELCELTRLNCGDAEGNPGTNYVGEGSSPDE